MIGRTLSHYKVLEELSRGGMGIVYRALDVKLDREVALKVLPPELVADPERKRRFIQEAKAAAKLNHPHIGMVHEIDEAEGVTFIAMELIRGEQLKDIINREKLPLAKSLELATEVAEGLSCAHDKGIVHRDLKPANIMVTEQGHAKIIDFGLAKLIEPVVSGDSEAETRVKGETHPGQVMGTVDYMSPEQGAGQKVDHRSDVWSFGVFLYEMLSGQPPFKGATNADTLGAILRDRAPTISGLDIEPIQIGALQFVLNKCLAKKPYERYQAIDDLLVDLKRVRNDLAAQPVQRTPRVTGSKIKYIWLAAGIYIWLAASIALVAAIGYFLLLRSFELEIRLTNPIQVTSTIGAEGRPSWSSDGRTLAYHLGGDIWVTRVGSGQPLNRTADYSGRDVSPSWSPDGSEIAYLSDREGLGVYIMPALSGAPRKIGAISNIYSGAPQWSRDGKELAYVVGEDDQTFMEILSLGTGKIQRVLLPGKSSSRWDIGWSSDKRLVAYVDADNPTNEVTQLLVLHISKGQSFAVTDGRTNVRSPYWSSDGNTLFFISNRGGSMDLWAQPVAEDGRPVGAPRPVSTGLVIRSAVFTQNETQLAYSRGRDSTNLWRVPILEDRVATWADAEQLTFDQSLIELLDVSPDRQSLLLSSDRAGNQDLWKMSVDGGEMQQLTADPTPDWGPVWSPDGKEAAFYSYRSGNRDLWVMPASGGPARQVTQDEADDYYPAWSPDGHEIAFSSNRAGDRDIWVISAEGGIARRLSELPGYESHPVWSPDGEWLVFESEQLGSWCLRRASRTKGDSEQFGKGPGRCPSWSWDGKHVYFIGKGQKTGNLWELSVDNGSERPITDLTGRRGHLCQLALTTDGDHLYFAWHEDIGDIWVMDVVYE